MTNYHDGADLPHPIPEKAVIIGVPERTDDDCAVCGNAVPWIWVLIGGPGDPDWWRGCLCSDCFDAYCPDDPEVDLAPEQEAE